MNMITANDLKTKGVTALQKGLSKHPEVAISVRGKERFVVMDMHQYHYLRECELEVALLEAESDVSSGKVVVESVDRHIKRIIKGIKKLCIE